MSQNQSSRTRAIVRFPVAVLKKAWFITWMIWSILLTTSLVVTILAVVILEWRSRRALDPDQITMMRPPVIIAEGVVDPFQSIHPIEMNERFAVLYATGRAPANSGDKQRFYRNQRGDRLRLGAGAIQVGGGDMTFDQIKQQFNSENRDQELALSIAEIDDFGFLSKSLKPIDGDLDLDDEPEPGDKLFAEEVNRKLATSTNKDVFIYVHGYKVVFENPLLVAGSLWHFTGYDGVMIAFAWPSTPNFLAYVSDLETTRYSARNLRLLVEFLSENTDCERIHILGYSAGTGLVMSTLDQLALMNSDLTKDEVQAKYRIAHVVLVCSDIDRGIFSNQLANGAWKIPKELVIYCSSVDSTLGMSQVLFGRERLGQIFDEEQLSERSLHFLRSQQHVTLIDVSNAENVTANNGHAYFHKSPWVSSDLLLTLTTDLPPGERMLTRPDNSAVWHFPDDYVERLKATNGSTSPSGPDAP